MSPSRMPASIIELPRTSSAKCSPADEQVGRHVDDVAAGLDRLDRRAGGDAAHHRHRDRAAARRPREAGAHAAEVALDDARREAARAAAPMPWPTEFGQPDHLDGARPVGQAADEAALLQRRDQPVDAGFRAQVERILHLVEGGRHAASFRRSWMKRRSSSCLRVSIGRLSRRGRADRHASRKQIMNGHYMFDMCSATL